MIIELLLDAIYNVISATLIIDIPPLPDQASEYINIAFDYIVAGAGLVANYVNLDYLMILFGVLLAVDVGILAYHLVMWILKKIPMLGIE